MASWIRIKDRNWSASLDSLHWLEEELTSPFGNSTPISLFDTKINFRSFDRLWTPNPLFEHFDNDKYLHLYVDFSSRRKTLGRQTNKLVAHFQWICFIPYHDSDRAFYWITYWKSSFIHSWLDYCGHNFYHSCSKLAYNSLYDIYLCQITCFENISPQKFNLCTKEQSIERIANRRMLREKKLWWLS